MFLIIIVNDVKGPDARQAGVKALQAASVRDIARTITPDHVTFV
jgi:hypothetical protein